MALLTSIDDLNSNASAISASTYSCCPPALLTTNNLASSDTSDFTAISNSASLSGLQVAIGRPTSSGLPVARAQSKSSIEAMESPQISGVKKPEKPFYMGLVDVPGIGYANTLFAKSYAGEFDPSVSQTKGLMQQALSVSEQSQNRVFTPAVVRLNVNPKDITLTYAKKVSAQRVRGNYLRRELSAVTGFVVEHHWDELDVVSLNCTTGTFWINGGLDYPRGAQGSAGFTAVSRTKSLAYRKLQAVMAMFRNNGCGWLTGNTMLGSSKEQELFGTDYGIVVNPGSAFMMYDGIVWYGHFESMNVSETGDVPFAFDFTVEFKVARTVDLNGISGSDVLEGANMDVSSMPKTNDPVADDTPPRQRVARFAQADGWSVAW